jgi:VIT1/CCC1 family predicted Fe2+/Mn2+ transporter
VILTGVAALVAGACSMGTGEYVSVTNQNELVHAEVATERRMHARFPITGRPILRAGLRQLALGALAVAVTFTVGSLLGATSADPAY